MGITPQELRKILREKTTRPETGGFVASSRFTQQSRPFAELTPRQLKATFHLGKTFR